MMIIIPEKGNKGTKDRHKFPNTANTVAHQSFSCVWIFVFVPLL